MPNTVRISQLTSFSAISGEDFIALVDSSSLTTYRTTITGLVDYFAASGSVRSASFASQSISSSYSSFSLSSSYATTSSYLNYPNNSTTLTSIFSTSSSFSSRSLFSTSSSFASRSFFSNSSSYASESLYARSSSFASSSLFSTTSSYASESLYSRSSSYASSSKSSSYAERAGYSNTAGTASYVSTGPTVAKAWVNFNGNTGLTPAGTCTINSKYNVDYVVHLATGRYRIFFLTPMPSVNYCFFGSAKQDDNGNSGACISSILSGGKFVNYLEVACQEGDFLNSTDISVIVFAP